VGSPSSNNPDAGQEVVQVLHRGHYWAVGRQSGLLTKAQYAKLQIQQQNKRHADELRETKQEAQAHANVQAERFEQWQQGKAGAISEQRKGATAAVEALRQRNLEQRRKYRGVLSDSIEHARRKMSQELAELHGAGESARHAQSEQNNAAVQSARAEKKASAREGRQDAEAWRKQGEAFAEAELQRKKEVAERVRMETRADVQLTSSGVVAAERKQLAESVREAKSKGDTQIKRERDAVREAKKAMRGAGGSSTSRAKAVQGQLTSKRQEEAAEVRRKMGEERERLREQKTTDQKLRVHAHDAVTSGRRAPTTPSHKEGGPARSNKNAE